MTNVKPWMLLVSLLVNAALLGFCVAQGARAFSEPRFPPRFAGPPPRHMMDGPPRGVLDQAFESERANVDEARRAMDAQKRKIESLLKEETLDQQAFDSAMAAMQEINARAFASLDRSLRAVSKRDAAERRAVVEALSRLPPPGPRMPFPGP